MSSDPDSLDAIIAGRRLYPVFQPILAIEGRRFIGYEGLIRGPEDSPFHLPLEMFQHARAAGRLFALERAAREAALESFARRELPGTLFLNCSPEALTHDELHKQFLAIAHDGTGVAADRIVIEVTELGATQLDERFDAVVAELRAAGYRLAIDDIGAGFGNAVLWDRMQPDIIKTDGRFASENGGPFKRAFIESLFQLASRFDIEVITEGIDSEQSLRTLREIGIKHVQGFLIQTPLSDPPAAPAPELLALLDRSAPGPTTCGTPHPRSSPAVSELIECVAPIRPSNLNEEVARRFDDDEKLLALPVVDDDDAPLGIVHRFRFLNAFARLYSRELYGRKSCTVMMQQAPLIFDAETPVNEVANRLSLSNEVDLLTGALVTRDGRYQGVVTLQQLLGTISELQIASARHANPLTNLPGNVPINERIDDMLREEARFTAAYIDIDRFKPFNDRHGFSAGDQLILALARSLERTSGDGDFIGHIGGDDFLALYVAPDWRRRVERVMVSFDEALADACTAEELAAGGFTGQDRRGNTVFHGLPTISVGAVRADAEQFESDRKSTRLNSSHYS